jgi:hypothetical protein
MRSVGSLEGSAAGVFVELTNAEVTRRVLKLQLHGEPASEEPFERIENEPGAKRPRFFEPFKWLPEWMAQSAVVRDYRALQIGRRRANRLIPTVTG